MYYGLNFLEKLDEQNSGTVQKLNTYYIFKKEAHAIPWHNLYYSIKYNFHAKEILIRSLTIFT